MWLIKTKLKLLQVCITTKLADNTDMIKKLQQSKHKQLITAMEALINAYIELAYMDVSEKKKESKPILVPQSLRKIKNQKLIPVTTLNIPIDPSCKYQVSKC